MHRHTAARFLSHVLARAFAIALVAALAGCAATPAGWTRAEADVLLLGEQHDAAEHQRIERDTVEVLAGRGLLAALALEMADQGRSTAGLAPNASEPQVREALAWNDKAWPWAAYGPAVMAAVRAGVPVLGANLPRSQMREAMEEARLDALLPPAALQRQRDAIREGHCGLMPEAQLGPMARIQIARDRAMAQTLAGAARPGRTVVLISGGGHADPQIGVPQHLPRSLSVKPLVLPAVATGKDYCAELRRQMPPAQP
jgi:uncharacterized iron-regulated protein